MNRNSRSIRSRISENIVTRKDEFDPSSRRVGINPQRGRVKRVATRTTNVNEKINQLEQELDEIGVILSEQSNAIYDNQIRIDALESYTGIPQIEKSSCNDNELLIKLLREKYGSCGNYGNGCPSDYRIGCDNVCDYDSDDGCDEFDYWVKKKIWI